MNYILKFIIVFVSIIVFGILISLTFFTNIVDDLTNLDLSINNIGKYELINSGSTYSLKEFNNNKNNILYEQITKKSNIFSIDGDYKTNINGDILNIDIQSGIFLFEINEVNIKVNIKGNGFKINNIGIGKIFINNINKDKILIYSINSIQDLSIYKDLGNEVNLKLFPNYYFLINNNLLKNDNFLNSLKNSDALKISKVLNLKLFNESIIINNEVNKNILDIFSMKNEQYHSKLKDIINYIKYNIDKFSNTNIDNIEIGNFSYYIDRYTILFKNEEKKKLYYKNIVLKELILLNKEKKENRNIQNNILEYLNKIKQIDIEEYNKTIDIINYFYLYSINNINKNYISIKNYGKILNLNNINNNSIIINKIYNKYNFLKQKDIFIEINIFLEEYIKEEELNKNNVDYILIYLKNIINNSYNLDYNYTENILETIGYYTNILIYNTNIKEISNLKTNIYNLIQILENIYSNLKNNFFEEERGNGGLLIRKNLKINKNSIINFKNNFDLIKNYINKNSIKITNDENKYILDFDNISKNIDEIIIALEDIEKYTNEYSKLINILYEDSLIKNDINIIDNIEKLNKYLNNFNGININNKTIIESKDYNYCYNNIIDSNIDNNRQNYCFEITNLGIYKDSKFINISFLFFPYEENKIKINSIEGQKISRTYNLNEQKIFLDKKFQSITDFTEKEKYNFNNFFINAFLNIQNNDTNLNGGDIEEFEIEEDKIIRTFKRNNLLGENGDFSILNGFLSINYEQIYVTKQLNIQDFDIEISNSIINTKIKNGNRDIDYKAELKGNYIYSGEHSFQNINLKFINIRDTRNLSYLLFDNKIEINEKIHINNIKENINTMLIDFNNLEYIIRNIKNITNNEIKIEYSIINKSFNIQTTKNGNKLLIELKNGKISKINYNGTNLININIEIEKLQNILNKLN